MKENLRIQNLRDIIARDISNTGLSIGTTYYVLKDILQEIEILYNKQVEEEYKTFCEEAKEDLPQKQENDNKVNQ